MDITTSSSPFSSRFYLRSGFWFPVILGLVSLVSRLLCRGAVYFADGPEHVDCILDKSYIIQPPGYWLFNRTAGLFSDPASGLAAINVVCSVTGVVVFYHLACFFTSRWNAFLAAFAYSALFYVWFSGEIHSSYATQILFPAATFYLLLCYERNHAKGLIWLAALVYAIGAGLRPTDGVFLIPLILYFAAVRMPRGRAVLFLSLCALFCMGWLIPTAIAFHRYGNGIHGFSHYVSEITTKQSVFTGVRTYTLANFVRYALPLLVGLWPVLGIAAINAIRNWKDWRVRALLIWILPGSLFFMLVLMACAPYLNHLTPAIFLLVLIVPRPSLAKWLMVTIVWNVLLFLAIAPISSHKLPVNILNSFVLRCTYGGIRQQYNTTLTQVQHIGNDQ